MSRRTRLIILGSLLIGVGVIIPSLYYSAYYNLLTGQVVSYEFPLLLYGVVVTILGVIVVVIGIVIKEAPKS